jgi:hypothetical protein
MRSRAVKYGAGEIGRVKVIEDFLPLPEALAARWWMPTLRSRRRRNFIERAERKRNPLGQR